MSGRPAVENKPRSVCIVGMGYVGLTLAVGLADVGYRVLGVENNPRTLATLQSGAPHFHEINLSEKYSEHFGASRISVSDTIPEPCEATVFIITVGTPIDPNKRIRVEAMETVASMIARALKPGDLVILRSTVEVGTTRNIVKPVLDGKNIRYFLAMCPERTVEGHALEELRSLPQVVGGIDAESTREASLFFGQMSGETVEVSSPEAAELAKLVCNTQRDLFFAYANEVALMAEGLGLNAREIIHAANHGYPRSRIALPGLVGGPCLEKDAYILAEGLERHGIKPELVVMGRYLNESLVDWGVSRAAAARKAGGNVRKAAILGLAFKGSPETDDMRGSLAISLHSRIEKEFPGVSVVGFDPVVSIDEAKRWGIDATETAGEALAAADIAFIQTNHAFFKSAEFIDALCKMNNGGILYDFWGCVDGKVVGNGNIRVLGLGMPAL